MVKNDTPVLTGTIWNTQTGRSRYLHIIHTIIIHNSSRFFIPKIQLLGELPAFKRRVMRPSTPQILGSPPSGAMHCHRLIEIRKFGLEIEVGVQKSATKKWDN